MELHSLATGHGEVVSERGFGAGAVGVDRGRTGEDVLGDAVLGIGGAVVCAPQPAAFVSFSQNSSSGLSLPVRTIRPRAWCSATTAPSLAVNVGRRSSIPTTTCYGTRGWGAPRWWPGRGRRCAHAGGCRSRVVRPGLGVVGGDVPVAVAVEGTRVDQLVLGREPVSPAVLGQQVAVGKFDLGVEVAPLHPGVGGRGVDVPPVLLGVLTVVSLVCGTRKQTIVSDSACGLALDHPLNRLDCRRAPFPRRRKQQEHHAEDTESCGRGGTVPHR